MTPGVVGVVTAGGIVFGWLRATTGSLWPVAMPTPRSIPASCHPRSS